MATRARKRHVQQQLRLKRDKNGQLRGGRRPGAGRRPRGVRSSERHKARPRLTGRDPILVTVRIDREVGNLRRRGIYHALRFALYATALREDFRVVHFSIQRTHLHMIVEAQSKRALSRGMQGLLISAARQINGAVEVETGVRRRGRVVSDRYHARTLTSPKAVRRAIAYVLNNWRRHGEHERGVAKGWLVDPFSTGASFGGWKELEDKLFLFPLRESYQPLMMCYPQTWLLRVGWERHGLVGAREIPGPAR
jgi:putative transposase